MKIRNINATWGAPMVFEAPTLGECKTAMAQSIRDSFAALSADDLAEGTDYELVTDASEAARALGRLGRGKHKTITEQDRERRREQARGLAAIRAAKRAEAANNERPTQ